MERTHLGGQRPPDLAEASLQLIPYHPWSHSSESDMADNLWFPWSRSIRHRTALQARQEPPGDKAQKGPGKGKVVKAAGWLQRA